MVLPAKRQETAIDEAEARVVLDAQAEPELRIVGDLPGGLEIWPESVRSREGVSEDRIDVEQPVPVVRPGDGPKLVGPTVLLDFMGTEALRPAMALPACLRPLGRWAASIPSEPVSFFDPRASWPGENPRRSPRDPPDE